MDPQTPSVSSNTNAPEPKTKLSLNFNLDLRVIIVALLLVVAVMLAIWKPWHHVNTAARTVTVTGETTLKAEPDEYQFNPTYQFKEADKTTAIKSATDKQTEIIAKLKELGVADKQIKSSVDGYPDYNYDGIRSTSDGFIYSLELTITLPTRAAAQKIQDYLTTTSPEGAVTPYANFSESLRKKLESQARDAATKEARGKADQSAKNLGFKLGAVKSIDDGAGFDGGISILNSGAALDISGKAPRSSLSVQPGENDLNYSVTVVYYIK